MWSNISAPTKSLQSDSTEASELKERSHHNNGKIQVDQNQTELATSNQCGSPLMRYKHAICSAPSGYIYIHGGRFGNLPLEDDIWRFDPHQNNWLQLDTRGCKPPSLQEHTLVEYNERLYLFGGQVSTSNTESSFWCLDLLNSEWRSLSMKSSKYGAHLGPTNRRGHSAVIYGNSMYIYGGFEDFRGSSNQLWEYDLINGRWELRNLSSSSAIHPEPRHSHSAIVHEHSMYIYGGLSNLKSLGDLWRWSWRDKRWYKERTRGRSPGQLHGHTAIQAFGSMFVFGGERNGRTTRSLWRLNLSNMVWQKIRPKGPRPSPITWHAAIANPLNILDETNYIIEGDSELLKLSNGNSQMLDNSALCSSITIGNNENSNRLLQDRPISHSKSSNVEASGGWAQQQQQAPVEASSTARAHKRKSRLSFLRRTRQDRPRSTYELKQIQVSASANNFSSANNNRHSIHVAPLTNGNQPQLTKPKLEPDETHVKILDNLDTDIKEMFQRAMSPVEDEKHLTHNGNHIDEDDATMSVETIHQAPSSVTISGRSQYETARQTEGSLLRVDQSCSSRGAFSQRTSYAYTTPPSELNTLTRESFVTSSFQHKESADPSSQQTSNNGQQSASFLNDNSRGLPPLASGYDRRNNRPKSEIVQSLIERADARIKHLYTPFFNQPTISQTTTSGAASTARCQRRHHINRLSLDKSKRHTIPQTMTYYNLYFSEDKSSNSPPASGQEDAMDEEGEQEQEEHQQQQEEENMRRRRLVGPISNGDGMNLADEDYVGGVGRGMTRDDVSSSTIKNSCLPSSMATSSGTLIGVHGYLNPALVAQMDQVSQLSLETINSSESRTLCANIEQRNSHARGGNPTPATFSAITGSLQSSLQNALTARRDTGESCDNTSLSFSIAELEEDDMLQYSSPTDPIIEPSNNNFRLSQDQDNISNHNNLSTTSRYRISSLDHQKELRVKNNSVEFASEVIENDGTERLRREIVNNMSPVGDERKMMAHKSASSGYDSMSGFEQPQLSSLGRNVQPSSQGQSNFVAMSGAGEVSGTSEDNTTHENSSVRTESSFNLTTETSPEQSAQKNQNKKLKGGRTFLNRRFGGNNQCNKHSAQTTTSSSITADSLALTSDGFECSSFGNEHPIQLAQTKSLPSSPPEVSRVQNRLEQATQHKVPLTTRSKFFGKQKSKTRYWQLCMFVIGGKQGGAHGINEPITIWRLYI